MVKTVKADSPLQRRNGIPEGFLKRFIFNLGGVHKRRKHSHQNPSNQNTQWEKHLYVDILLIQQGPLGQKQQSRNIVQVRKTLVWHTYWLCIFKADSFL